MWFFKRDPRQLQRLSLTGLRGPAALLSPHRAEREGSKTLPTLTRYPVPFHFHPFSSLPSPTESGSRAYQSLAFGASTSELTPRLSPLTLTPPPPTCLRRVRRIPAGGSALWALRRARVMRVRVHACVHVCARVSRGVGRHRTQTLSCRTLY